MILVAHEEWHLICLFQQSKDALLYTETTVLPRETSKIAVKQFIILTCFCGISANCHKSNARLKPEDMAAHAAITVLLAFLGSMLFLVRNTVILRCFDALVLVCKSSATAIPMSLLLGIGLTWSNSRK